MTTPSEPIWVDTPERLAAAATELGGAAALAIDTEADSFYHYFHKCCLIQVSDGHQAYLIDPLALKDAGAMRGLFDDPGRAKVLHAAEQDVLYLRRDFGLDLHPLFDTMIAAQLLGKKSVGLAGLLQEYFAVVLDKGCQRDDWSRRPLTTRQMAYAAEDVRHLIRLRHALESDLEAKGRLEWAREEFEHIARRAWAPREFDREEFWGITLWTALTHCFQIFDFAPYLELKSAEKRVPFACEFEQHRRTAAAKRAVHAQTPPFDETAGESILSLIRCNYDCIAKRSVIQKQIECLFIEIVTSDFEHNTLSRCKRFQIANVAQKTNHSVASCDCIFVCSHKFVQKLC